MGQSELGSVALLKAVWWDLRLAGLLTHLFFGFSHFLVVSTSAVDCLDTASWLS